MHVRTHARFLFDGQSVLLWKWVVKRNIILTPVFQADSLTQHCKISAHHVLWQQSISRVPVMLWHPVQSTDTKSSFLYKSTCTSFFTRFLLCVTGISHHNCQMSSKTWMIDSHAVQQYTIIYKCFLINKSSQISYMPAHVHTTLHASTHTHTHTQTQPFYDSLDFVWDNLSEPVPEQTFTHWHLLWSSIVPYLLHPSNMIHGILPVQFTHLSLFPQSLSKFSLVYLLAWHPPLQIPYISSPNHCLCNTCPYHCSLFCCSTEIMSFNPSLSVNTLLGILSCSFTPHIHLTILISAW